MNALEGATKATPGFAEWEKKFKAFNKATAVRHNKEALLNGSFKHAPKHARHVLHSASRRFIDFKWEHFEEALFEFVLLHDVFWEHYNDDDFASEPWLVKILSDCRADPHFGPTADAFFLIAKAVLTTLLGFLKT